MIKFEPFTSISGQEFIRRFNDDKTISEIPCVEGNSDYQAYLEWLKENA